MELQRGLQPRVRQGDAGNGFEWGVAWAGQSDTMHFELVEGRRLLESGGTRALVAGQQLAAQEAKAAQDKKAAEQKAAAAVSAP